LNKPIGEIQKNVVEKIVAIIGTYQGKDRIDIRTYFNPDQSEPDNWVSTKKGINIDVRSWKDFKNLIGKIDKAIAQKGELDKGRSLSSKDKREHIRLSTSRNVDFGVKGHAHLGSIKNRSNGGVFIKTTAHFSEGEAISMTIESPSFENEKRTGRIVRVTPDGIGVKFTQAGYSR
jgi:hypothetical protein